jgi:site-specific DNA-methyltransferase (adenine-specific)
MRGLPDRCVDLIIADPPYGLGNPKQVYNRKDDFVWGGYQEAPLGRVDYARFTLLWVREASRLLRPGGSIFVFSGWTFDYLVKDALVGRGLNEVNHIIWKYQFGVNTKRKFVSSHYVVFFFAKPKGRRTFNLECRFKKDEKDADGRSLLYRDLEDVWTINRKYKPGKKKNQNELPEEIIEKILLYCSNEGDLVLDPFLGGFTTARVARRLGRRCIGFEVNPTGFEEKASEVLSI